MGRFFYENQGNISYLVYETDQTEEIDTVSLGMLTYNQIPHLADVTITQMNNVKRIRYNITSKVPLNQYLAGVMNKNTLLSVFEGICLAYSVAREYMIDVCSLILDESNIYVNVSTAEVEMICIPIVQEEQEIAYKDFFRNILFKVQYESAQGSSYVTEILNYLNRDSMFDVNEFQGLMNRLKNDNGYVVQQPLPNHPRQAGYSVPENGMYGAVPNQNGQNGGSCQPVVPTPPTPQIPQTPPASQVPAWPNAPVYPGGNQNSRPGNEQYYGYGQATGTIPNQYTGQANEQSKKKKSLFKSRNEQGNDSKKKAKKEKETKKKTKNQWGEGLEYSIPGAEEMNGGYAIPGQIPPITQTSGSNKPSSYGNNRPTPMAHPSSPTVTVPPQEKQPHVVNYGETVVLNGYQAGETTVLKAGGMQMRPTLIRKRNNETVVINKPTFRIGKEKSYVDYFIGDNTAISRSHADIITRNGQYYIVDMNSTNHTYVNGVLIQSNVEVPIAAGTKLRLANEDFEFILE